VLRSCRKSHTPRERTGAQPLTLKKLGQASLANQKRSFVSALAADLAGAVRRHWFSSDTTADWEKLVREEHQAASEPRPQTATGGDARSSPAEAAVKEVTVVALRGRFKEHVSLEFASEIVRQIQSRLASRDERGRPLMVEREARLVADTARTAATALAARVQNDGGGNSRFTKSTVFQSLIAAGSRRVLSHAVETFDLRQPERFLAADGIDELIQSECQALLEESLARPDFAETITALIDIENVTALALEHATTGLLQCGFDRRTLLFVPKDVTHPEISQHVQSARPLAAVVAATVEDVQVVSEETGISPRSIAMGLERVYPGIAEAAGRLHTRIDVEWRKLV
jgi:hypothetical protein